MEGFDLELSIFASFAFVAIGVLLTSMILFTKAKLVDTGLCKIRINEDEELTKDVEGGSTLLATLTSACEIPVPSPCGGKATCKQCKVKIIEGAPDPLETDKSTFSKKELLEGWRLSCQAKVKHDLGVEIEDELLGVKEWGATVISNNNVATFIKELVVEVPEDVPYKSGGYLQFHVPTFKTNSEDWKETMEEQYYEDWEKFGVFGHDIDFSDLPDDTIRAYSMASYPAEGRKLMFNIRIATPPFDAQGKIAGGIPWGICSSYTFSLKPGDKVRLSGPYGESFMINDDRELVFLIGGAGSSFGRSHIMHLLRTENSKRKITLWYGARSLKENIYQDEYEKLAKDFENFDYRLVLSNPTQEDIDAGWDLDDPVKTAFLFKAFEEGQLKKMDEPEECLYYICGPPMHNQSVIKLLDDYGVPPSNIVLDDFGS
ncbi:MAG: NADH:ubiquinone reductase (Na(+)-transporting) subunit F [Chlamydiales bacterium]|nr:NADH:ubiquinone reductase (Na(+)-transporting) subunit F [Chlamydiales bacterium]